ncbi:MAG: hypothetical protein AAF514_07555 [Verrucomicrobiota bacterium]
MKRTAVVVALVLAGVVVWHVGPRKGQFLRGKEQGGVVVPSLLLSDSGRPAKKNSETSGGKPPSLNEEMILTSLDSDRWESLGYHWTSGSLPEDLRRLRDDADMDPEERSRLRYRITDQIYHQRTPWGATYLAVPWLVALFDSQPEDVQIDLAQTIGYINLERGLPSELTQEEIDQYHLAMQLAAGKILALFERQEPGHTDYQVLGLLGAVASLHGHHDSAWRLDRGTEEDFHQCLDCDSRLMSQALAVAVSEVENPDDFLDFDESSMYATRISRNVDGLPVHDRIEIPDDNPDDNPEKWLIDLCESNGHPKGARWLRQFFGSCDCPDCGTKVEFMRL